MELTHTEAWGRWRGAGGEEFKPRTKSPLAITHAERLRDAIVGAVCRLLGLLLQPLIRTPRGGWPTPRRILVLKPCCLGDVLFTTPLLAAIRTAYPSSHLTVATSAWSAPVLVDNPHIDALFDVPSRIGLRDAWRWAGSIRAAEFDCALVPDRSPVYGLLVALAGIPRRAGLDSGGRGFLYTDRVPITPDEHGVHEADLYARVGAAIGAPPLVGAGDGLYAARRGDDANHGDDRGAGLASSPLGDPSGWWRQSRHGVDAEALAAGAVRMRSRMDSLTTYGGTVLLLGTETDADAVRSVRARDASTSRGPVRRCSISACGRRSRATRRSTLAMINGMTHCALAGGTPTLAVFAPTDPRQYGVVRWAGDDGRWARAVVALFPAWQARVHLRYDTLHGMCDGGGGPLPPPINSSERLD